MNSGAPVILTQKMAPFASCVAAALVLLLGTFAIYWPVRHYPFVNYDDPVYVSNNPYVLNGYTHAGIAWAFGRVAGDSTYWHPLTWLSHMLDASIFGMKLNSTKGRTPFASKPS